MFEFPFLFMMSIQSTPPSASRLRRLRASATKRKLYNAAIKNENNPASDQLQCLMEMILDLQLLLANASVYVPVCSVNDWVPTGSYWNHQGPGLHGTAGDDIAAAGVGSDVPNVSSDGLARTGTEGLLGDDTVGTIDVGDSHNANERAIVPGPPIGHRMAFDGKGIWEPFDPLSFHDAQDLANISQARSSSTGPSGQPEDDKSGISLRSPWQFLLPRECANASVTCKTSWKCVAEWTPIGEQYLGSISSEIGQESAMELFGNRETIPEELDADDLEQIYQTALRECPNSPARRFQELLDEKFAHKMQGLSS